MTFETILIKLKYLRIHNIAIRIHFHQKFKNECVWKNFLKFSYRRKDVKEFFFERCRRINDKFKFYERLVVNKNISQKDSNSIVILKRTLCNLHLR